MRSMQKKLRYLPTAFRLGGFLALTYLPISAWDGSFPKWPLRQTGAAPLPGFDSSSQASFFPELGEAFVYGLGFALAVPIVHWSQRSPTGHKAACAGSRTPTPRRCER